MELEDLLSPVATHAPCGDDLSFSREFDDIADMRRHDDPTLAQGEWVTELKVANWPGVAALCGTLLHARTKDLRLAMWLTEAWAMTRGFEGLDDGLRLCTQLCERYWSELYPQADGSDQEERIGNMAWLLQRVLHLVDNLPVVHGRQGQSATLHDLAQARQLHALGERAPEEAARLAPARWTVEQFQRALRDTPSAQLLATRQAMRQCQAHLLAWQAVVDQHMGADGPSFVQAKEALARALHEMDRLVRDAGLGSVDAGDAPALQPSASTSAGDEGEGITDTLPFVPAGLRTRAQALAQLQEVAAFFRRTEPHSPVAYLAEKAVAWGNMPLHEWLRQVIKDDGTMAHVQELLGLGGDAPGGSAHSAG
jgi:type VI secretion system protein ImpA